MVAARIGLAVQVWGTVCVAHCANPPKPTRGQDTIAQSSCGAVSERASEIMLRCAAQQPHTHASALSAVLGNCQAVLTGGCCGFVVAQPCTLSCVLLPSVASLQRLSLFGL